MFRVVFDIKKIFELFIQIGALFFFVYLKWATQS